jgi:hypothetical protein
VFSFRISFLEVGGGEKREGFWREIEGRGSRMGCKTHVPPFEKFLKFLNHLCFFKTLQNKESV